MKRKICVITGSRSEYGLLASTLRLIRSSRGLILQLVVTGAHLSPDFGYTVDEITGDGFKISSRVKMLVSADSTIGVGKSIGIGILGFVDCFKKLKPDIILLLGDRFEILAAATAAMAMNLPIAHISGGDVTKCSIDEQIRHAITKMSHIHFVGIEKHAERVRQMGEEPWRVHVVGEPCIDNIRNLEKMPLKRLEGILNLSLSRHPVILVTFHPVTLQLKEIAAQTEGMLCALNTFDSTIIFTHPNADAGWKTISAGIGRFLKTHPNAKIFKSLGSKLYLNLLSHVDLIVGNSSSSIVEAPSFRLPAVNIGQRQIGRVIPRNVVCVSTSAESVRSGIRKALSVRFKKGLSDMKNPYDKRGVAPKIVKVLSEVDLGPRLLNKNFIDFER